MLTEEDFSQIEILQPDGSVAPINAPTKRSLIAIAAYYHDESRKTGSPIVPSSLNKALFDEYRITALRHKNTIVPYSSPIPGDQNRLSEWNKSVKISAQDFKVFKDEAHWHKWRERTTTTLQARGILGVIQPVSATNRIEDPVVDRAQQDWVYKILQDTVQHPRGKAIVNKHIVDKDVRAIWAEFEAYYNKSMAAEIRLQQQSTYLTSSRWHTSGWRGSKVSYILNWNETFRQHSEISPQPYTQQQGVRFLNSAISGIPNLRNVLHMNLATRKAAGSTIDLNLEEYTGLLIEQAQVEDSAEMNKKNPSVKRSVNSHDLVFDDDEGNDHQDLEFENYVHDIDTPAGELLAYQAQHQRESNSFQRPPNGPSSRVYMTHNAWSKFLPADRKLWLQISEPGKRIVLGDKGTTTMPTRSNGNNGQRRANTHEQFLVFDDSPDAQEDVTGDEHAEYEADTHQMVQNLEPNKSISKPQGNDKHIKFESQDEAAKSKPSTETARSQSSILKMAKKGIDINQMLSQGSCYKDGNRQAKFHEVDIARSDMTLEFNMHETIVGSTRKKKGTPGSPKRRTAKTSDGREYTVFADAPDEGGTQEQGQPSTFEGLDFGEFPEFGSDDDEPDVPQANVGGEVLEDVDDEEDQASGDSENTFEEYYPNVDLLSIPNPEPQQQVLEALGDEHHEQVVPAETKATSSDEDDGESFEPFDPSMFGTIERGGYQVFNPMPNDSAALPTIAKYKLFEEEPKAQKLPGREYMKKPFDNVLKPEAKDRMINRIVPNPELQKHTDTRMDNSTKESESSEGNTSSTLGNIQNTLTGMAQAGIGAASAGLNALSQVAKSTLESPPPTSTTTPPAPKKQTMQTGKTDSLPAPEELQQNQEYMASLLVPTNAVDTTATNEETEAVVPANLTQDLEQTEETDPEVIKGKSLDLNTEEDLVNIPLNDDPAEGTEDPWSPNIKDRKEFPKLMKDGTTSELDPEAEGFEPSGSGDFTKVTSKKQRKRERKRQQKREQKERERERKEKAALQNPCSFLSPAKYNKTQSSSSSSSSSDDSTSTSPDSKSDTADRKSASIAGNNQDSKTPSTGKPTPKPASYKQATEEKPPPPASKFKNPPKYGKPGQSSSQQTNKGARNKTAGPPAQPIPQAGIKQTSNVRQRKKPTTPSSAHLPAAGPNPRPQRSMKGKKKSDFPEGERD